MQIDFHHAVTYIIARLANLSHEQAEIVAHAAQYVDDAINTGYIKFDNRSNYSRIATAHQMLDYRNFEALSNSHTWVPFHFLPGNDLKRAGSNCNRRFIYKMICKPNSYIAQDMLRECIKVKNRPYGLHLLGIAMHTYADTWAHYGFCGIQHEINRASNIMVYSNDTPVEDSNILNKLSSFFTDMFDQAKSQFISGVLPIGHGAVLSYPDLPYLKWQYTNGLGDVIIRDNPTDYVIAIQAMHRAIMRFNNSTGTIPARDLSLMHDTIRQLDYPEKEERHRVWLQMIREGRFSFGAANLEYTAKGEGSWKYEALHTRKIVDDTDEVYKYDHGFLSSNWKLFHDAAILHRFNILRNILPRYGICLG